MNYLSLKKIYIALLLGISLISHYGVQAQEHVHESPPECSAVCTHHVDIEVCHDISSAQVLSDIDITVIESTSYTAPDDLYVNDCNTLDDQEGRHRIPSHQELARSHMKNAG